MKIFLSNIYIIYIILKTLCTSSGLEELDGEWCPELLGGNQWFLKGLVEPLLSHDLQIPSLYNFE